MAPIRFRAAWRGRGRRLARRAHGASGALAGALVVGGCGWAGWELAEHELWGALAALCGASLAALGLARRGRLREQRRRRALVRRIGELAIERDGAMVDSDARIRYFAVASHELRRPLHALAINATALDLLGVRQADEALGELSRNINAALAQSNRLLDGLLDLSRMDAATVVTRTRRIDAAQLLRGVADEFGPLAALNGLALLVDVPAGPTPVVETDQELLLRMLHNLVANAVSYTQHGSVTLRVGALRVVGARACRELVVEDTGPGIAPDEQRRVFDEFYRGAARLQGEAGAGLGLGLSIVRRAARVLDIPLEMRSELGSGTRVTLLVPSTTAPPLSDAQSEDIARQRARLAGLRVLVVDDDAAAIEALRHFLPMLGCEVVLADSAAAAYAALAAGFAPDAVLVEPQLRVDGGAALLSELRDRAADAALIIVTADISAPSIVEMQGHDGRVLHKPVDGRRIAEALALAVGLQTDLE